MSIHTEQGGCSIEMDVTFLQFWTYICQQIGNNRLELNLSAKSLQDLFIKDSIHPEHLKKLVTNSLKNKQGTLDQKINLHQLLDDLGLTAYTLRQGDADDLFDIELLEEIAWHISERFSRLFPPNAIDHSLVDTYHSPNGLSKGFSGQKGESKSIKGLNSRAVTPVISISRFLRK